MESLRLYGIKLLAASIGKNSMKLYYLRFKKWMEQKKVRRILNMFIVLWAVVLITILAFLSINDTALSRVLGLATQITPTPSPTPTVTPLPTYAPTLTPTSVPRQNTYDPDPIIDCKSDNLGVLRIRRSECTKGTECNLGNNRWVFAASVAECVATQIATDTGKPPQQNISRPTQQTNTLSYHCFDNTYNYWYYTSSGEQCNTDNVKSTTNRICYDTQQLKSNTCSAACARESDNAKAVCLWAYTGENAGVERNSDLYGECLNGPDGVSKRYGNCLSKCTDQYAIDIKQCN